MDIIKLEILVGIKFGRWKHPSLTITLKFVTPHQSLNHEAINQTTPLRHESIRDSINVQELTQRVTSWNHFV